MPKHINTSYSNSSIPIKILAWLTVAAFGFVLFHMIMMQLEFIPEKWVKEIYFVLQNGIPFFLFLTGSFIRDKPLRIPMILFFSLLIIGYLLITLDQYDIIDMRGLKWIFGPGIAGLFITYIIHFFRKIKKTILDFLKLGWFLCVCYFFFTMKFSIGVEVIRVFFASMIIFPFMMGLGLFTYFRKAS